MPSDRIYFQASVSGAKELAAIFDELPKALSDQVLRNTAKKALQPVEDDAKTAVLHQSLGPTAQLLNSIEISTVLKSSQKTGEQRKPGDVVVYVGATSPKGNVAHLVEFGTGPRYSKTGHYSGVMPAEPFMRPAWDRNKNQVLDTMRTGIWSELVRAVRRLRNRALAGKLSAAQTRFFAGQ